MCAIVRLVLYLTPSRLRYEGRTPCRSPLLSRSISSSGGWCCLRCCPGACAASMKAGRSCLAPIPERLSALECGVRCSRPPLWRAWSLRSVWSSTATAWSRSKVLPHCWGDEVPNYGFLQPKKEQGDALLSIILSPIMSAERVTVTTAAVALNACGLVLPRLGPSAETSRAHARVGPWVKHYSIAKALSRFRALEPGYTPIPRRR